MSNRENSAPGSVTYIRIPQEIAPNQYRILLDMVAKINRNARLYRRYLEIRGTDYDTNLFMDLAIEFDLSNVHVRQIIFDMEEREPARRPQVDSDLIKYALSR